MANPDEGRLNQLKNYLAELETKYKEKHPDIVATKKRIADLEKKSEASKKETEEVKEKEISSPAMAKATPKRQRKRRKSPRWEWEWILFTKRWRANWLPRIWKSRD